MCFKRLAEFVAPPTGKRSQRQTERVERSFKFYLTEDKDDRVRRLNSGLKDFL